MHDLNLIFSNAQTVTGTDTTVSSTDWVDLKVAMDLAAGDPVAVEFTVATTFSGGTSVRPQICACESDGSNLVVLDELPAIAIASLTAPTGTKPGTGGYRAILTMSPKMALPAISGSDPRQALRVQYTLVGAVAAGAMTARLIPTPSSDHPAKAYPTGY